VETIIYRLISGKGIFCRIYRYNLPKILILELKDIIKDEMVFWLGGKALKVGAYNLAYFNPNRW